MLVHSKKTILAKCFIGIPMSSDEVNEYEALMREISLRYNTCTKK